MTTTDVLRSAFSILAVPKGVTRSGLAAVAAKPVGERTMNDRILLALRDRIEARIAAREGNEER